MIKNVHYVYQLYCFIKRFIAPRNTEIKPLGKVEMDEYTKSKALKEMLLTDNLENKCWGYYT